MKLEDLANPHIRTLEPYKGGKPIEELERDTGVRDPIKLASNESPQPPSERSRNPNPRMAGSSPEARISFFPRSTEMRRSPA